MQLTFKLYAGLSEFLPSHAQEHAVQIEIDDGLNVFDIVDRYGIPREMIHLVLKNGVYLHQHEREDPGFKDGDVLAIWPPVAGG